MYLSEPLERMLALLISCNEGGRVAADVGKVKKAGSNTMTYDHMLCIREMKTNKQKPPGQ